jgi:hypothetical protein
VLVSADRESLASAIFRPDSTEPLCFRYNGRPRRGEGAKPWRGLERAAASEGKEEVDAELAVCTRIRGRAAVRMDSACWQPATGRSSTVQGEVEPSEALVPLVATLAI